MRLIDADKIPYVQDVTYMKDYDYAYRYAIEAEPTVDAIPISFIVDFKDQYCYAGSSKVDVNIADALVELLLCWEEEQEKKND